VEARVLSPIVIIVVALSGIGGYAQPSQELGAAVRVWRTALVLLAAALGLFGVMAGLMELLRRLSAMEDLGRAYLWPLCDRGGNTP
jgi:spore germination protein KA